MCPKDKLFRGYINLEIQLREFDNARKLYEKFLEFGPDNCTTWIKVRETPRSFKDAHRGFSQSSSQNWKVCSVISIVPVLYTN